MPSDGYRQWLKQRNQPVPAKAQPTNGYHGVLLHAGMLTRDELIEHGPYLRAAQEAYSRIEATIAYLIRRGEQQARQIDLLIERNAELERELVELRTDPHVAERCGSACEPDVPGCTGNQPCPSATPTTAPK